MEPLKETAKNGKAKKKMMPEAIHPDHAAEVTRLRRIKGQVEGVEKMITSRRYCPDIIMQIRATRAALLSLENSILKTHLKHCVKDSFKTRDSSKVEEKVQEIIDLISK